MKFRWKLLILLLFLAMVPALVLRTFGARHLQMLSAELVTRLRTCRQATVETQLRFLAKDYATRLHANIRQAETLVNLQAVEVQRCLRIISKTTGIRLPKSAHRVSVKRHRASGEKSHPVGRRQEFQAV